ncbi:MAG: thioredoxin family protein [Planctomycetota bacterium]
MLRTAFQVICFAGLFVVVGVLAYRLSGAGDFDPGDTATAAATQNRPHYPSHWLTDWSAAATAAQAEHKPILAEFQGSDWCIWCKHFHREIVDTPEFQAWAGKNVVLLDVDFPQDPPLPQARQDANNALAQRFKVDEFPTLLLLTPDGKELARMGYVQGGPKAWLPHAEAMVAGYQPQTK